MRRNRKKYLRIHQRKYYEARQAPCLALPHNLTNGLLHIFHENSSNNTHVERIQTQNGDAAFLTDHFSRDTPHHLFVVNVQTKNWLNFDIFVNNVKSICKIIVTYLNP